MGIQSTRYITRKQAEALYVEQYATRNREQLERQAKVFTDAELEDEIELTFDNYIIIEESQK